jgi:acyl-coenzyme A thioesterase PaaI-like protein
VAAVYEIRDGTLYATELSRGPWDPGAQHGGAPAAVLMRAFEAAPGNESGALAIGRVTYELLRPVPLGPLSVSAEVVRPGKRVQLLEGVVATPDGVEVVRARALRVARAPVSAGSSGDGGMPAEPSQGVSNDFRDPGMRLFPRDAMEIRFVAGRFLARGPASAWFRLRVPLVEGEEPSGRQRLAAAADFPNGIATELPWEDWLFINPDLTVTIDRDPVGEWIGLDARMRVSEGGLGQSEAVLYDSAGRVGRSLQTLYVAPRP